MLEFRDISKAYGPVRANRGISFRLREGTIHALVGENGAGKSTLMKILFGLEQADQGEILLRGERVVIESPRQAKKFGIGMIHQHFQLAGALTAIDHVILEEDTSPFSFFKRLNRPARLARMYELSEKFGLKVVWSDKIDDMPVGIQQRVEILKLLAFDARILILDEPTAVLTPAETESFLERLKHLKQQGKTIVLITHKLKEVMAVADDVTVLRQGVVVSSGSLKGETEQTLASKMVGGEFHARSLERTATDPGKIRLKVDNLVGTGPEHRVLDHVSFELRAGEVLGIAGVEGNGQSELIRALTLPQDGDIEWHGQVQFEGRDLLPLTNPEIRRLGIGLIPEDRLRQAVIPTLSAKENFQLGRTDWLNRFWLREKERNRALNHAIHEFAVTPAQPDLKFASFSGGNQQKLVVARELGARPRVLIVAQPTRGVDIGAIERIYEALIQARNQGLAILLISSELEELLRLSDRLLVLCKGKIQAEMNRAEFDVPRIGRLMGGSQ